MKKQLISLISLALLTLVACKQPVEVEETESPDYAAFDKKVEVVRAFYQAHSDENLEAQKAMISDTLKWSPPDYNGNKWYGKEDFISSLKSYHDGFDDIQFTSGVTMPDTLVNGYWAGSIYPKEDANINPNVIRVYGTWTATHTESGKKIGVKYFSLTTVNADGKIVQASDYWDVNGLAAQIASEE